MSSKEFFAAAAGGDGIS